MADSQKVEGAHLFYAIAATKHAIKVLENGAPTRKISASMALQLIKSGVYCGYGSHQRIRHIRQVDTREFPIDSHYWDDRACIRFWTDQRS